jgi:hypothetical protein
MSLSRLVFAATRPHEVGRAYLGRTNSPARNAGRDICCRSSQRNRGRQTITLLSTLLVTVLKAQTTPQPKRPWSVYGHRGVASIVAPRSLILKNHEKCWRARLSDRQPPWGGGVGRNPQKRAQARNPTDFCSSEARNAKRPNRFKPRLRRSERVFSRIINPRIGLRHKDIPAREKRCNTRRNRS